MTITVVVPVRNGASLLEGCVAAVLAQSHPPDDVLVVVGSSTDETLAVADGLAGDRVRVIENPEGDRASAINRALGTIDSDLVALVDAQATLAGDYLAAAERALTDSAVAVVGGPMRPRGHGVIGQAMAAALQSPFGVGDSQFHFAGAARDVESVYLGVYRRSVFATVGRYNTSLLRTEDDDLNARVRAAGMRIRLDPSISSTYRCRESLGAVWHQYFGYGYWKVALGTVRRDALRIRHLVPAGFVLALASAVVLAIAGWWLPLAALVIIWLVMAVVAALMAPADSSAARVFFPLVTLTMHLAYGIGTLAGILALPRLRRTALAGARQAEAPV